jgi:hypothetical protein
MISVAIIDGAGVYGSIFHYALVIAFVASAFLIFFTLWRKGRLDMDEGPKFQMMEEEEGENRNGK